MIEQTDDRQLWGLDTRYVFFHRAGAFLGRATLGGGLRADDAQVGLWHSPGQVRRQAWVDSQIRERNLYLWAQDEIFLSARWRAVLGLRGDYFTFDVDDHLEGQPSSLPHASGYAQEGIFNPRATLVFTPVPQLDLFANFGTGFHSNDARDAVIDARVRQLEKKLREQGDSADQIAAALEALHLDPAHREAGTLPRAAGGELGLRARLWNRLNLGAAAWWLDLEREFVYVGDAGATELSGRTRRLGLDLEARVQLCSYLWADADANFARARRGTSPRGQTKSPWPPPSPPPAA